MTAVQILVLLVLLIQLVRTWRSLDDLKRRVLSLESEVDAIRLRTRQGRVTGEAPAETAAGDAAPATRPTVASPHGDARAQPSGPAATTQPDSAADALPLPPPLPTHAAARAQQRVPAAGTDGPRGPGLIQVVIGKVKEWFTEGNVPVKIGMLVLLAGVAALLRYASDQGWLTLPIQLRLAGISLAALAGLAFGWHKRRAKPAFALAVQGGAIGVLLLAVFAATRLYEVMPQGLAFGLSVALVAGLGVLAVLQDSRTLAVFGVLAGFLAPIWLSDGSGNHVALFSYYTVLNLAIVAVAWWRSWWILNLLGFVFTWGVGIAWGVLRYEPHLLPSVQPFLVLFFLLYFLIPIINARKRPARLANAMDACLLFGTPLLAFALQAGLLPDRPMALAYAALALALLYAVSGWWLRHRLQARDIALAHLLLAAGFATVLVPLAFPGNPLIVVYAMEAAAIAWYSARRQWLLGVLAGLGLLLIAAFKHLQLHLLADAGQPAWMLLNPLFLTGAAVVLGALAIAGSLHARHPVLARLVYLGGLLYWIALTLREVFAPQWGDRSGDAVLVLAILSGYGAMRAWQRYRDPSLTLTGLLGIVAGLLATYMQVGERGQPLADTGWLAWPLFGVLGWLLLRRLREEAAPWSRTGLLLWWGVWAHLLSVAAFDWLDQPWLGHGWRLAGTAWPWLALVLLATHYWPVFRRPIGAVADPMRWGVQAGMLLMTGLVWLQSLWLAGDAAPLPWIVLFNPLELSQFAAVLVLAGWLKRDDSMRLPQATRGLIVALAGLVWVTSLVLHAVHHWGGVPWDARLLDSSLPQTSLTLTWSVLGVAGWIIGSRRGHRGLWLTAAALMAIVLAKLVLVDRQHLGNLLGIGSFIAYGLLCTVVGYVAPAPPRAPQAAVQTRENPT